MIIAAENRCGAAYAVTKRRAWLRAKREGAQRDPVFPE
jgi:hypothetical protein